MSAASTQSLYLAGNSGSAAEANTTTGSGTKATVTTTAADQQGRLTKLNGLDGSPLGRFQRQPARHHLGKPPRRPQQWWIPAAIIYVLGNATGNFGSQINQGSQDVYLTKYDSAGHVTWSNLVGSAGQSQWLWSGAGSVGRCGRYGRPRPPTSPQPPSPMAIMIPLSPAMTPMAARPGSSRFRPWRQPGQCRQCRRQRQCLYRRRGFRRRHWCAPDQPGQGRRLSRQIRFQGQSAGGKPVRHLRRRFRGRHHPPAPDGSLYVASVQNGEAIISKYAGGNITAAPTWTQDLGRLVHRRRHWRASRFPMASSMSPAHQQSGFDSGGAASVVTPSTGRHRRLCLQSHRQWQQRHRQPCQLYRHRRGPTRADR